MFTAVYLANNINTDWHITFHYFNIAMAVMIATIFCQYLFTSINDKREFLFILGIEFLIILGLMLGYYVGIYFCIAAYIMGLILPIFL